MNAPQPTRPGAAGVGRDVAEGLELVVREWAGRLAMFTGLLLVVVAALQGDAGAGLRAAGVGVGLLVVAAVVHGWWRRTPGVWQWSVAVVGVALTVGMLIVVGRA